MKKAEILLVSEEHTNLNLSRVALYRVHASLGFGQSSIGNDWSFPKVS